jgi:tetratricopeptide (TPR) repeat protein
MAFSKPSFLRTMSLALAAIAALFSVNTVLAKMERAEMLLDARRLFDEAQKLRAAGRYDLSIDRFESAVASARDNSEYQLALGETLASADRLTDATNILNDLLEHSPASGPANLAMARVLVKQNRIADASFFYHRAIFGQWKADTTANRVTARFELVDLLAKNHSKEGLLAELLPLQEEAPPDAATRERLANLFLLAGSPVRARDNLREARRLQPQDQALTDWLNLVEQVLSLDPTQRGLTLSERSARASKLLELAYQQGSACGVSNDLLDSAAGILKQKASPPEEAEARLDLAERLWRTAKANCQNGADTQDTALDLVLTQIVR